MPDSDAPDPVDEGLPPDDDIDVAEIAMSMRTAVDALRAEIEIALFAMGKPSQTPGRPALSTPPGEDGDPMLPDPR